MPGWKCIAYLPGGEVCGRTAAVVDPIRRGMICARCADIDRQLESDAATRAFNLAKRAVEASPDLREYAQVILSDWTREDDFWNWIATAPENEIIHWARANLAPGDRMPF